MQGLPFPLAPYMLNKYGENNRPDVRSGKRCDRVWTDDRLPPSMLIEVLDDLRADYRQFHGFVRPVKGAENSTRKSSLRNIYGDVKVDARYRKRAERYVRVMAAEIMKTEGADQMRHH